MFCTCFSIISPVLLLSLLFLASQCFSAFPAFLCLCCFSARSSRVQHVNILTVTCLACVLRLHHADRIHKLLPHAVEDWLNYHFAIGIEHFTVPWWHVCREGVRSEVMPLQSCALHFCCEIWGKVFDTDGRLACSLQSMTWKHSCSSAHECRYLGYCPPLLAPCLSPQSLYEGIAGSRGWEP